MTTDVMVLPVCAISQSCAAVKARLEQFSVRQCGLLCEGIVDSQAHTATYE